MCITLRTSLFWLWNDVFIVSTFLPRSGLNVHFGGVTSYIELAGTVL